MTSIMSEGHFHDYIRSLGSGASMCHSFAPGPNCATMNLSTYTDQGSHSQAIGLQECSNRSVTTSNHPKIRERSRRTDVPLNHGQPFTTKRSKTHHKRITWRQNPKRQSHRTATFTRPAFKSSMNYQLNTLWSCWGWILHNQKSKVNFLKRKWTCINQRIRTQRPNASSLCVQKVELNPNTSGCDPTSPASFL